MSSIELAIHKGDESTTITANKVKLNVVDEGIMEVLPGHQETIALGKGGSLEVDGVPVAVTKPFLVNITHGAEGTKMVIVAPEITE